MLYPRGYTPDLRSFDERMQEQVDRLATRIDDEVGTGHTLVVYYSAPPRCARAEVWYEGEIVVDTWSEMGLDSAMAYVTAWLIRRNRMNRRDD